MRQTNNNVQSMISIKTIIMILICLTAGFSSWATPAQSMIPGQPIKLSFPAIDNDGNFRISWLPAPGTTAQYYQTRVKEANGAWSTWQSKLNSSQTMYDTYPWLDVVDLVDGVYTYEVRTCNPYGCGVAASLGPIHVLITNISPTVNITSHSGSVQYYSGEGPILLEAKASDADGTITKVEFYVGTLLLGEATLVNGVYQFPFDGGPGLKFGNYTLNAKAFDNSGKGVLSEDLVVNLAIGINDSNLVAPEHNGQAIIGDIGPCFSWSTNNSRLRSWKVQVGTGSNLLKSHWEKAINRNQSHEPLCWNNGTGWSAAGLHPPTSVPNSLSVGTYYWRLFLKDNRGKQYISHERQFMAINENNQPPTISVVNPQNNGWYYKDVSSFNLSVKATDPDSALTRVRFFVDDVEVPQNEVTQSGDFFKYAFPHREVKYYHWYAIAEDDHGTTSTFTPIVVRILNRFDSLPSHVSPIAGGVLEVGDANGPCWTFNEVTPKPDFYQVAISTNSNFGLGYWRTLPRPGTNTTFTQCWNQGQGWTAHLGAAAPPSPLPVNQTYYWRAFAYENTNGQLSRYSYNTTVDAFTVVPYNHPPQVSLQLPAHNIQYLPNTTPITLKANASDNDGNLSNVEFLIRSNGITTSYPATSTANSEWSYALNRQNPAYFYWKVKATDNQGKTTTSEERLIRVIGALNHAATKLPVNGAVLETRVPDFTWYKSSGANYYRLYMSESTDFETSYWLSQFRTDEYPSYLGYNWTGSWTPAGTHSPTNLPALMERNKNYYWKVLAMELAPNGEVRRQVFSDVASFSSTNETLIRFNGEPQYFEREPAQQIPLYVDVVNFDGLTRLELLEGNTVVDTVTAPYGNDPFKYRLNFPGLMPASHYVHAKAYRIINGVETSIETAPIHLMVVNQLASPTLFTPKNFISINQNNEPCFQWAGVNGAESYTVQVGTSSDLFTSKWIKTTNSTQLCWGSGNGWEAADSHPPSSVPTRFNLGEKYYWRVRAKTFSGSVITHSALSMTENFTPDFVNAIPQASLLTPSNNEVFLTDTPEISLTASASDTDGSVKQVDFYVNGLLRHTSTSVVNGVYEYLLPDRVAQNYSWYVLVKDNLGASKQTIEQVFKI